MRNPCRDSAAESSGAGPGGGRDTRTGTETADANKRKENADFYAKLSKAELYGSLRGDTNRGIADADVPPLSQFQCLGVWDSGIARGGATFP